MLRKQVTWMQNRMFCEQGDCRYSPLCTQGRTDTCPLQQRFGIEHWLFMSLHLGLWCQFWMLVAMARQQPNCFRSWDKHGIQSDLHEMNRLNGLRWTTTVDRSSNCSSLHTSGIVGAQTVPSRELTLDRRCWSRSSRPQRSSAAICGYFCY